MTTVGPLVATGRTSDVFAFGEGSVVKVPHPRIPEHWAELEAGLTAAVRSGGVPAPEVQGLVEIDGRTCILFERVHGPSMWQVLVDGSGDAVAMASELAAIQSAIHATRIPDRVPALVDRMAAKIGEAEQLSEGERAEAAQLLDSMPRGAALLHGDLHPANVLMAAEGPVVIDWFDAAVGHPVADVIRSSLLIRPIGGLEALTNLPGAQPAVLSEFHDAYLEAIGEVVTVPARDRRSWEALVAASRLVERAQDDESQLLALWEARPRG